jgi:hypothetical protein
VCGESIGPHARYHFFGRVHCLRMLQANSEMSFYNSETKIPLRIETFHSQATLIHHATWNERANIMSRTSAPMGANLNE